MSVNDEIALITNASFGGQGRSIRGYAAELLFSAEAAARGFVPATPGWNISMDLILVDVEHPHRLVRVEVKQSIQKASGKPGGYVVELRSAQGIGGAEGSKKGEERVREYNLSVDLLALYLPLEKTWYIVPESELRGRSSVTLRPGEAESRLIDYREAWHLIGESMHEVGDAPTELDDVASSEQPPLDLGNAGA